MRSLGSSILKGLLLGCLVLSGLFIGGKAVEAYQANKKLPAIFRIGQPDSGPTCSAFAIDNKRALTAKHCMTRGQVARSVLDFNETVTMYNDARAVIGTAAVYPAAYPLDIALIEGDFSKFNHLLVEETQVNLSPADEFQSCGFPYMIDTLVCSGLRPYENEGFHFKAKGYITMGFSGGPVINISKGTAVGVNSAVTDGAVVFTPILAISPMFARSKEVLKRELEEAKKNPPIDIFDLLRQAMEKKEKGE